ncbi:MAG: protein translocase subunit SecD [Chlamydiae bacterium]|nr:protein translocase subunit SecD [Chlamydiota bacterium]MBI3277371.1 protein translocase subunit SecD [Chlamydiota bacterium]
MKNLRWRIPMVVLVVAFFVWKLFPIDKAVTLGLDLQGGMHVVLEVDLDKAVEFATDRIANDVQGLLEGKDIAVDKIDREGLDKIIVQFKNSESSYQASQLIKKSTEEVEVSQEEGLVLTLTLKDKAKNQITHRAHTQALEVIRNRVDKFGVAEPSIQPQGKDRIVVQLPGAKDLARAENLLRKTAVLEFRMVSDDQAKLQEALKGTPPPGYEVLNQVKYSGGSEFKIPFLVKKKAELTGASLVDAKVTFDQMTQPQVSFTLDHSGASIFAKVTEQFQGRRLGIVLDNEVQSAPVIKSIIPNGQGVIEGQFTPEEARDLCVVLTSGALPAPVKIIMDARVGPSLGADSVKKGFIANIAGLALVLVFMVGYYFFSGFVAVIALILNLVMILGAMAFFKATLSMPGIAGMILTIGMAVDANVLIFERIREEVESGKKIRAAIAAGYHKAFSAILDSNLTTIITAVILYKFGTGPVKGFAVTLTIGLLISMFTAIVVTRVIFDLVSLNKNFSSLKMLKLFSRPNIDWVGKRFYAYVLSLAIILGGCVMMGIRGHSMLGNDFTGGDLIQLKFSQNVALETVREKLSKLGLGDATLQRFGGENEILIKTKFEEGKKIRDFLGLELKGVEVEERRREEVGPSIGKEIKINAVWALILSLIGILIYVTYRFEFEYALGAIIALIHDALVPLAFIAFTGRELSVTVVAAILTIIGYSVNDTIVICDRIRENKRILKKISLPDLLNLSLNQTLSRTCLTSLTVLLVVLALFFFGGEVINDFAFCMLVGTISGSYSTLFIAVPVILEWQKKFRKANAQISSGKAPSPQKAKNK